MSQPGTLPAALDFLPQWLQAADASALDATLASWVRVCGWRSGGFVWPADATPAIVKVAPNIAATESYTAEMMEAVRRVRAGEPTAVVLLPGGASRVYAPAACPGKPLALIWAERPANQSWSDADRSYLALTGKLLE
ncbi:MAG TPA: hypothetical protein VGL71_11950, partial [Urbifossiella sp.]